MVYKGWVREDTINIVVGKGFTTAMYVWVTMVSCLATGEVTMHLTASCTLCYAYDTLHLPWPYAQQQVHPIISAVRHTLSLIVDEIMHAPMSSSYIVTGSFSACN